MTPRERVTFLLHTYHAAVVCETGSGRGSGRTRADSIEPRFPDIYYDGSYAELDRALRELRLARPVLHWHVMRRYVYADVLPMTVPVRRTQHRAIPVLAPCVELAGGLPGHTGRTCRVVVRRWDHRVLSKHVDSAIDWLAGEMRDIRVPRSLLLEAV